MYKDESISKTLVHSHSFVDIKDILQSNRLMALALTLSAMSI